jgi:hypothetical protein
MLIPVPFDPDQVWSAKPRHLVRGEVNGRFVRGAIETHAGVRGLAFGPMWIRDCGLGVGETVEVELEAEGPQREELAPDVAAALAGNRAAADFFDGLATFYRKGYLRWVDATTRRPELRAQRIARMVELLAAGVKDHRSA